MENFEELIFKPASGRCGLDEQPLLSHACASLLSCIRENRILPILKDTTGRSSIFQVT